MKISDVHTAKGLKFKLVYGDNSAVFCVGALITVSRTSNESEFLVKQYGAESEREKNYDVLCKTDRKIAEYIHELLDAEAMGFDKCVFCIEGVEESTLQVQAYTFRSIIEYKTPIYIRIPGEPENNLNAEKLYKDYVWTQLGQPALFCLNYKSRKKQAADARFLSGDKYLTVANTPRGIIIKNEVRLKDRNSIPVDIYIAPEIKFITSEEMSIVNGELAKELDKISSPATYFARWEAYNELSEMVLKKEKEDFGSVHYNHYSQNADLKGTTFEFNVDEEIDSSFIGKELIAYKASETSDDASRMLFPSQVGAIKRITEKSVTTFTENINAFSILPASGNLTLNTIGDKYIMKRRDLARKRMIGNKSPIRYIVSLIEVGASNLGLSSDWGSSKAVTAELKRNFKKASDLNPAQIEALNIAVNTPDIAIIQGPPGTGKTTVIKAICERFREIFEEEEKRRQKVDPEYTIKTPKILISSFQNEAVDNAISAPLPGDLPAHRIISKRAKNRTNQYRQSLDAWYKGVCSSISELISQKTVTAFVENRRKLSDDFISYKNSGESLDRAAELIEKYLSYTEISYPQDIIAAAQSVIKAAEKREDLDDIADPIVIKLQSQRLERESFGDDGQINAKRLLAHLRIRDDLEIEQSDIAAIEKVCGKEPDENEFTEYAEVVRKLQKRLCSHEKSIDVKDKRAVDECLLALHECFVRQYISTLSDLESKKSLILSEFLLRLEHEYEEIVQKYSMTTAATCQTSLDTNNLDQVFDLVVIDEAARANPLDLFIPMSMGRKIVLVGDHKQLPHMLEPDVLKMLTEDPKFKDLPEIEKSLFERLFDMFGKGQRPKSVLLTEQFRMHPEICAFVSDAFYDGKLRTSEKITPKDRSSPIAVNGGKPITLVNVPITKGAETPGVSKSREAEVKAVAEDLKVILDNDNLGTVGIITFYSAQASKIKQKLDMLLNEDEKSRVEVGTVDAFQGKEFDYVMLSCVRSNRPKNEKDTPNVGFLEKPNRLCVAFSRVKRQLITYGDIETLKQIPCFSKLYDICAKHKGGCYREY